MIHDFPDIDDDEELFFIDIRRQRVISERPDHFTHLDSLDFVKKFRLTKPLVLKVLELIEDEIRPNSEMNNAVPALKRLLVCLRYYATGSVLLTVADFGGISVTSAHDIVKIVTNAIARLSSRFVKMPQTLEEISEMQKQFFQIASFPRCIGAIDCTHIKIISPGGNNAELFRNRKGYFSINLQTVCDANLKVVDFVASWPGSAHNFDIFSNSRLMERLESGEFGNSVIVGDSGYPNRSYIVTPLEDVRTPAENLYNESQTRTRNVVEQTYSVLKRRFPILSVGMKHSKIEMVQAVIAATIVLHNLAVEDKVQLPNNEDLSIGDDEEETEDGDQEFANQRGIGDNDSTRRTIINYFQTSIDRSAAKS